MKNKLDLLYYAGFVMMAIGIVINFIIKHYEVAFYIGVMFVSVLSGFATYMKLNRTMCKTFAFLSTVGGIMSVFSVFVEDPYADLENSNALIAMIILVCVIGAVSVVESVIYWVKNNYNKFK